MTLLLVGLSLSALQPSKSKVSVKGLATALAEEFQAARQLAIASGRPVAVGIPTDGGGVASSTSTYRLEGWNRPLVTSARDYRGDYPHVVFLAARWGGPTFADGLPASPLSKYGGFELDEWLPEECADDYIFCFTPDGGLVSNGQGATDGRYTVVVTQNPNIGGSGPNKRTILGGDSAVTLLINPAGGVEQVVGLPGGTLGPPGSGGSVAAAKDQTQFAGAGANVKITKIRVLPNPDDTPADQGICVPGQVVTLEVFAYDPQGRTLFSKWTQEAEDPSNPPGQFSYPYSNSNAALVGEVDKMEYVYTLPENLEWVGDSGPPPGLGAFRARWNWTVPIDSEPGDRYRVQADVRDVKGEVYIQNPPQKVFTTPPSGKLLVERRDPNTGLWQLVLMNPDGSGEKVLSPKGVEESMPSLDRSGTKLAVLQGSYPNRFVKVRNLHGGPEEILGGPGPYTSVSMSPDGAWVSYRLQQSATDQKLFTRKLDGSVTYQDDQVFSIGTGHSMKKSRTGWSQNSRYMLYEKDGLISSRRLSDGHTTPLISTEFWNTQNGYDGPETPYAPISYSAASGERVMLSLGSNNPVLVNFPVTAANYDSGGIDPGNLATDYVSAPTGNRLRVGYGFNGPSGADNDYPDVSSDGQFLIWTRSPQTSGDSHGSSVEDVDDQRLWIVPRNGDNFIMGPGGPTIMSEDDVRRAIWIPAEQ